MKKIFFLLFTNFLCKNVVKCAEVELKRSFEQSDCPGSCSSIINCKTIAAKILGFCSDGKICCRGNVGLTGSGFPGSGPSTVSCGASVMANKVVSFTSPIYPAFSGGSMTCEFTLQINPATVGIRVDFIDLSLPSVPTNPVNFFESPNSVCDSDFFIFRGFSGWSPDFRCGNLTGYSFLIEREEEQPTLTTLFIMASANYRWNIKYTELYYNDVESMDYALRSAHQNNFQNEKKQWMYYVPSGGSSLTFAPINVPAPGLPPSMLAPSSWQIVYPLRIRNTEFGSEVEYLNETSGISPGGSESEPAAENEGVEKIHSSNSLKNNNNGDIDNELSRIVGGMNAKPNSIPWQVSLQIINQRESNICGAPRNLSSHFCGGSIISDRAILTASHCFYSSSRNSHPLLPARDLKVVVGEHDLCSENEVSSTREYHIERIVMHFNYLASDVINDLAVIYLKKPIKFDKNVHPIKMADDHDHDYSKLHGGGMKPLLSGWGSLGVEENSTYPSILQETSNIHIFSEEECQFYQMEFLDYVVPPFRLSNKYKAAFNHGICTKPTDKITEAGFGDSGGPLAGLSGNGKPVLFGVVSHMRPHKDPKTMEEFHLNYFAKVSAYRKWIMMASLGL